MSCNSSSFFSFLGGGGFMPPGEGGGFIPLPEVVA